MKRSLTPESASIEAKRFDPFVKPPQFNPQKHQQQQQRQQQIFAQQQMQSAAAAAHHQQQQQFQMQHQYAANPSFFSQPPIYPMNPVNMPTPPMMYNSGPPWNFMSTPPPFFNPTQQNSATASSHPPLPPPDFKSEKPPPPREPDPNPNGSTSNYNSLRARAPNGSAALRVRGVNALNGSLYNGFNGSAGIAPPPIRQPGLLSPSGNHYPRQRWRNPHNFAGVNTQYFPPRMDYSHYNDVQDMSPLANDEDQPSGPDKLTIFPNNSANGSVQVYKKAKRKSMSWRYARCKEWRREDAEEALALEKEYRQASRRNVLILKFPDPDLNNHIVKKYSPFIDTVHFQQPSTPRYCFVQLKEGADVQKVIETINEIPFGIGKVTAELKLPNEDNPVPPEGINPYTLYVGNLSQTISANTVKAHFPTAQRVDVGHPQKMRNTRYAFVRYNTFEEARDAFKKTVNSVLENRSLIVRFRRENGNLGLPGESRQNAPSQLVPENVPTDNGNPEDDDDHEDYHEDDAFLLEDTEEDDQVVEQDASSNSMRTNSLPFNLLSPKQERLDEDTTSNTASRNNKQKARQSNTTATESSKDSKTNVLQKSNEATKPSAAQLAAEAALAAALAMAEKITAEAATTTSSKSTPPARKVASNTRSKSPDCVCTGSSKVQPKARVQTVKVEQNVDEDSSDGETVNLLGTRVKDEFPTKAADPPTPTMDDVYLDDYEYDDLDKEPEEEDDDWADTSLTTLSTRTSTTNWEEVRRRELNTTERKPDLDKLGNINETTSSAKPSVLPIVANLEPKREFDDFYATSQGRNNLSESIAETDDLHNMFADMNSDYDEDEDSQF